MQLRFRYIEFVKVESDVNVKWFKDLRVLDSIGVNLLYALQEIFWQEGEEKTHQRCAHKVKRSDINAVKAGQHFLVKRQSFNFALNFSFYF